MSKLSKILLLAAAIGGLLLAGRIMSHRPASGHEGDLKVSASEPAPAAPEESGTSSFYSRHDPQPHSETQSTETVTPEAIAPATVISNWQGKVDQVLESTLPEPQKARQMLELLPYLPPDGQEEVAEHITNLLPDQDYGLMQPYLTNAALPEEVSDILLDDALNRPNSLKLPALLEVARTEQHPKAAEAKDFLELFLDEDYGNNWDTWRSKMEQWLAENPD
jgi:hypothetical protein